MHPHVTVLLQEVVDVFKDKKIDSMLDGTLGMGGHSEALLKEHPEINTFIGIDQDKDAIEYAKKRLSPWENKLKILYGNFSEQLFTLKEGSLDGIVLDLGVSSLQLDETDRGFSFMREGPLDMRMDHHNPLTAEIIVNSWEEQDIARVIRDFGEEKQWKYAARLICKAREVSSITTTTQLANILRPLERFSKKKQIHPATLTFQGLRIAVNDELGAITRALPQALKLLKKGGLLAVISFHSLEDRIVKEFMRYEASDKESTSGLAGLFIEKKQTLRIVSKKPITPTPEEENANPRSRSAKLRVAEKL